MSTSETSQNLHVGSCVWFQTVENGVLTENAAIVTRVYQPGNPTAEVDLTIFRAGRAPDPSHHAVHYSAEPSHGSWCWPKD